MLKIYLDNCCYNRPFDNANDENVLMEAAAKLFIQSLIKYGDVLLVSSFVLHSEIMDNPAEYKRNSILRFVDNYAKTYVGSETRSEVTTIADEIMKAGIKTVDAAHIACAVLAESDYFITTDKRILRHKTDRTKIVNPITFVKLWKAVT